MNRQIKTFTEGFEKNAPSDKFEPKMRALSVKGYSRQAIDSFLLPAGVFANSSSSLQN